MPSVRSDAVRLGSNLRQALTLLQVGVFLSPPAGHDFIVLAVQIVPQLRMCKRGGKWRAKSSHLRCYPRDMAVVEVSDVLQQLSDDGWSRIVGVVGMGRVVREGMSMYFD